MRHTQTRPDTRAGFGSFGISRSTSYEMDEPGNVSCTCGIVALAEYRRAWEEMCLQSKHYRTTENRFRFVRLLTVEKDETYNNPRVPRISAAAKRRLFVFTRQRSQVRVLCRPFETLLANGIYQFRRGFRNLVPTHSGRFLPVALYCAPLFAPP